jgi:Transmembrane secretion effector
VLCKRTLEREVVSGTYIEARTHGRLHKEGLMSDTAVSNLHPLHHSAFRLLWAGNSISSIGDQFYFVALPWLVLQLSGSSVVLGTITMTAAIPRAALMLVGGALSDRFSPRGIMIGAASLRAVVVAAISALIWTHSLLLWPLYVLAFCFGVADAFAIPAAQTYLPSLVAPQQLASANALFQSTVQVTTLVAPAPAGLFIKAFGTAWALFIDAVSFLFIIGALWALPDPPEATLGVQPSNVVQSIVDGLGYVQSDVALTSLVTVVAVLNFAISGPATIGVAFIAKEKFGSPASFGLLISALAAGSLTGLLSAGLFKQHKRGRLLLLVSAAIGVCLGSIGWIDRMPSLAAVLFLMSCAAAFLNVQLLAWFQQRVERAMMGRVLSVLMFAAAGLTPVSMAIAGIAIKWSLPGMFLIGGSMVLLVTLLAATHRPVREID